jgi:hypothetical protein
MVAVFPNAIKTFSYRQDYTDLVDAADVNVSYDEINAVQKNLGVLANTDVIDGATNTWSTVGKRISAVREGVSKPFCNVQAHNVSIPYGVQTTPSFTSKTWDTHGMWNGSTQLVCPRSGVYSFEVYIRWHPDNLPDDNQQPVFNHNGELFIALNSTGIGGNMTNQGGFFPIGWQKSTHQSASMTLPWIKGDAITAIAFQSCLSAPIVSTIYVSITYHRDPPTTNNL